MKEIKKFLTNFIKKGNYTKTKLIASVIISVIISLALVLIMPTKIWDRFPIFLLAIMFVLLHLIFPLKEMYEFIHKKRYLIAVIVLAYILVMGYSSSSIGMYRYMIQPNENKVEYGPVLGKSRSIRSDEWNVNSPIHISQAINNEGKFSYFNDNLRGTSTDMFSVVASPVNDIVILARPFYIGFMLFGAERGLAFHWFAEIIALMLVSYELCLLITNKKKLVSLLGMILIVFSAATQWWNITTYIIWGGLALVLLDKFMLTDKYKIKLLCAFGIFISALAYMFILYPAWQVPYAYTFLPIFIWIIWKNRKAYKMNWKDVLIILFVILAIAGIFFRYYSISRDTLNIVMNTDYPGQRFEKGGDAKYVLYSYVYSMFFPYDQKIENPCEMSGMLSIFPIPMIIACLFLIRSKDRKKHFAFLIPMLLIGGLLSYWCLNTTNELFAKVTFLYMCPATRVAVPLGFLQILLMLYVMGNIKEDDKILGSNLARIIAVILSIGIMSIAIKTDREGVMGNLRCYISGLILVTEIYLLFTVNKENSKKALIALLIPVALITGATVNPIQKGISVLTDKPIARKVQEIVKEDPENNLWLAESLPDYYLVSGAKVLNSVNIYPNFEMYKTILGDRYDKEEYRTKYNRFAHVMFQMVKEESYIELLQADAIIIKLNANTIKDLGVKYIVYSGDLEEYNNEDISFENIYDEDGLRIYKAIY